MANPCDKSQLSRVEGHSQIVSDTFLTVTFLQNRCILHVNTVVSFRGKFHHQRHPQLSFCCYKKLTESVKRQEGNVGNAQKSKRFWSLSHDARLN